MILWTCRRGTDSALSSFAVCHCCSHITMILLRGLVSLQGCLSVRFRLEDATPLGSSTL
jgi:hypothetical protein